MKSIFNVILLVNVSSFKDIWIFCSRKQDKKNPLINKIFFLPHCFSCYLHFISVCSVFVFVSVGLSFSAFFPALQGDVRPLSSYELVFFRVLHPSLSAFHILSFFPPLPSFIPLYASRLCGKEQGTIWSLPLVRERDGNMGVRDECECVCNWRRLNQEREESVKMFVYSLLAQFLFSTMNTCLVWLCAIFIKLGLAV